MKVVVAGGSGFVGRHVVAALQSAGHEAVVVDRGHRPMASDIPRIVCDLGREELPHSAVAGADAIVNLVGIKRASPAQGFTQAHVEVTRRLIAAAQHAGIRRFVQVSVVGSRPDPTSAYHDSKWTAEELVHGSGLAATILRPAVIYGGGDDMLTHLVKMIRFAPVFPIVGTGHSHLQPIDVRDVATAVVRALERPKTAGSRYDLVGPERLRLREIVRTVADGLELSLAIRSVPRAILRPLVGLTSRLSSKALSTPSQLRMLEEGMVGDSEPARRDLGLEPRPFTSEAARRIAAPIPPLLGVSLRLVSGRARRRWLDAHRSGTSGAVLVALSGMLLMPLAGTFVGNVWYRMALCGALLTGLSLAVVRLPWRELFRPTRRSIIEGAVAGGALYAIGATVFAALLRVPGAPSQIAQLYRWRDAVDAGLVIPLLLGIIAAEEIVWRNAVTLPLAARLGPWRGVALAAATFAAAHIAFGVPVLLVAALGAGFFWSALVVKTRSAVPSLVSHILWDVTVLFLCPYGAR